MLKISTGSRQIIFSKCRREICFESRHITSRLRLTGLTCICFCYQGTEWWMNQVFKSLGANVTHLFKTDQNIYLSMISWWTLLVLFAHAVLTVEVERVYRSRGAEQVVKLGLHSSLEGLKIRILQENIDKSNEICRSSLHWYHFILGWALISN